MVFWSLIKRIDGQVNKIPRIAFAFLGCGVARAWLWWILSLVSYSNAFPEFNAHQSHLLFDVGEIVGFFLLAFAAYKASPFFRRPSCVLAALILTSTCGIGTVLSLESGAGGVLGVILVVAGGIGYAALFLLWLEVYGCLTARNMLIAWTGSYVLAAAIWLLCTVSVSSLVNIAMCVLPALSLVMLLRAFCRVAPIELPTPMECRPSIPWKLVIVLSAFAFAFGIGDVLTGQNMFTWVSKIGMGIPEVFVLVCVLFFYKRFSFKYLITLASLFIVAGLIGAFFVEGQASLSFILINASSEIYLILVYTIACSIGHQVGSSAIYLGGLFAGLYKVFLQLGKILSTFIVSQMHDATSSMPVLAIIIVLLTITASIVLIQDQDIVDKFSWNEQKVDPQNAACAYLQKTYRLTPKETSVLLLLAKGQDVSQIADELFLAQSTVRVHSSSIYKKLNVHSRKELDSMLLRQESSPSQCEQ